jgi:hypothetical protein
MFKKKIKPVQEQDLGDSFNKWVEDTDKWLDDLYLERMEETNKRIQEAKDKQKEV